MSEEVGKALQSVVERVNQAAARRPKVNSSPGSSSLQHRSRRSNPGVPKSRVAAERLVMLSLWMLCKTARYLNLWMGDILACGSTFITPRMANE